MIVVILISLGVLFILQFSVLHGSENTRQTFTQQQLASNTLNAFVLTTTSCQGLDVTELVQDCAGFRAVNCSGISSCGFLDGLSRSLFNKTLRTWEKRYNFTAVSGRTVLFGSAFEGCPGTKDTSVYPIPPRDGGDKIFVRLEVCGGN